MVRSSEEPAGANGEWECMECGYVEEGVEGRRPKKCPECDAPASALEFFSDEETMIPDRSAGDDYDEDELEKDDEDEYEEEDRGSIYR
jgi:hypothetical protein